jgi:uncharacterized OB-fold protein
VSESAESCPSVDFAEPNGSAATSRNSVFLPENAPWIVADDGRVSLTGSRCEVCSRAVFPALSSCPSCGELERVGAVQLSPVGKLYSFTDVHVGRPPFPQRYTVGLVDLEDDVRVVAQIVGPAEAMRLDEQVECRLGVIAADDAAETVSYRFVPVRSRS